jgi:hypothetical protein
VSDENKRNVRETDTLFESCHVEDITADRQAAKFSSEDHKCWGKSKTKIEVWGEDKEAPAGAQAVPPSLRGLGYRLARPEAEGIYVLYVGPAHISSKEARGFMSVVEVQPGYKYDGGRDARRLVPVKEIGTGNKMLVSPLKLFYTRET